MKHVVVNEDIRIFEVQPAKLFDVYLQMIEQELGPLLKKWDLFDINCPGCNSQKNEQLFKKFGMTYVECQNCKTVFVTPRPSESDITQYYQKSKSMTFWLNKVYKATLSSRKRVIVHPRAFWIVDVTETYLKKPVTLIDFRTKYNEFLQALRSFKFFDRITLVEPYKPVRDTLSSKNIRIHDSLDSVVSEGSRATVFSALEVIDRVSNPKEIIQKAHSLLEPNGLLFLTTTTISGFDLQILWQHSKSIHPLDHMNLFSTEGITKLLTDCGFEIIELSTIGQLDLEIVRNAVNNDPTIQVPRFVTYLLENRDERAHRAFQDFLQQYNLSSPLRIVAQKK
ncbi:MAG: methyltransferase domain-containing protein [Candidatus Thermoplasmatota archaeon]